MNLCYIIMATTHKNTSHVIISQWFFFDSIILKDKKYQCYKTGLGENGKKLRADRIWWSIFTLRCLQSFYGYWKDPFLRNINIEGIHKGTNWPYIKMIMMTIMKTIKRTGSNYRRIYKMPAWTSYFVDIFTNPHNMVTLQWRHLLAYFH